MHPTHTHLNGIRSMCCLRYPKHLCINRSFVPHVPEVPLSSACAGNGVYLPPSPHPLSHGFPIGSLSPAGNAICLPIFRVHTSSLLALLPYSPPRLHTSSLARFALLSYSRTAPPPPQFAPVNLPLPPPFPSLLFCRAAQHIPSTHTQFPAGNGIHVIPMLPLFPSYSLLPLLAPLSAPLRIAPLVRRSAPSSLAPLDRILASGTSKWSHLSITCLKGQNFSRGRG